MFSSLFIVSLEKGYLHQSFESLFVPKTLTLSVK